MTREEIKKRWKRNQLVGEYTSASDKIENKIQKIEKAKNSTDTNNVTTSSSNEKISFSNILNTAKEMLNSKSTNKLTRDASNTTTNNKTSFSAITNSKNGVTNKTSKAYSLTSKKSNSDDDNEDKENSNVKVGVSSAVLNNKTNNTSNAQKDEETPSINIRNNSLGDTTSQNTTTSKKEQILNKTSILPIGISNDNSTNLSDVIDISKVTQTASNIYNATKKTVKNIGKSSDALDDGFQASDIPKIVGSTAGTALTSVLGGGLNVFKGVENTVNNISNDVRSSIIDKMYGKTGVSGLIGDVIDSKVATDTENITAGVSATEMSEAMDKWQDKYLEGNSVLGSTSKSILEGVGYSAVLAGAEATGGKVLMNILTFMSATGSTLEELEGAEGITVGQKYLKAVGSGSIETFTENLFGLFGETGLDDAIADSWAKNASSALEKVLKREGVSMGSEASEEVISYFLNFVYDRVLDAVSNGEGYTFADDWDWEEVINSAFTAGVSAGISGASLTANNIHDIASANNMSVSEATQAYANVQDFMGDQTGEKINTQDLDMTLFTDENYKEITDMSEKFGVSKEEIIKDVMNNKQNATVSDNETANTNKQAMQDIYAQNQSTSLQNNEVSNSNQQVIPQNTKTAQNETSQQTDLKGYNQSENLQNYVKSAQENGIDVNHDTTKALFNVIDKRDVKASFQSGEYFGAKYGSKEGQRINAVYITNTDENGKVTSREIIINAQELQSDIDNGTAKSLQAIAVHELIHDMEGSNNYSEISKLALEKMKTQEGYQEAYDSIKKIYEEHYTGENIDEKKLNALVEQEMVADYLGENLGNQEYINELVESTDKSTIDKVITWIKNRIESLKNRFKGDTEAEYWRDVKEKLEKAYNEKYKASENSVDTRYSAQSVEKSNKIEYNENGIKLSAKEYNAVKSAINTDSPNLANGTSYKLYGDYMYVFNKKGFDAYDFQARIEIEGNEDLIDIVRKDIDNGTIESSENFIRDIERYETEGREYERGRYNRGNANSENNGTDRSSVRLYQGEGRETSTNEGQLNKESNRNKSNNAIENSEQGSFSINERKENNERKEKQFEIIQNSNPMEDDYHTGIRTIEDIKTLEEVVEEEGLTDYAPDLTKDMIEEALDTGEITVYSSYPIEQGVFVTPSQMEAKNYAGNGEVYSKVVNINDVAWIDTIEGQYAEIDNTTSNITQDNQGRSLSKEQQEYFKDSKVVDEEGNLVTVYHGTNNDFTKFDKEMIGSNYNQDEKGFFFTDDINEAKSYANNTSYGMPRSIEGKVYEVYLNIENPLLVNIDYDAISYWDENFENLLSNAEKNNNDGIIIKASQYGSLYVAFESNQIKNVDNTTPTTNEDIRYSIEENSAWEEFLKRNSINEGTKNTINDIKLPEVQLPVANNSENVYNNTESEEDYGQATNQSRTVYQRSSNQTEIGRYEQSSQEYERGNRSDDSRIQEEIEYTRQVENFQKEQIKSLGFDDKSVNEIYRNIADKDDLTIDDIYDAFDGHREIELEVPKSHVAYISRIRNHIRGVKLDASSIKNSITDYNDFRKANWGKITIANSGLQIDSFYRELSEMYPDYFDDSIANPLDQLYVISDFMNNKTLLKPDVYTLTNEDLEDVANEIYSAYNSYNEFKRITEQENSTNDEVSSFNLPKNEVKLPETNQNVIEKPASNNVEENKSEIKNIDERLDEIDKTDIFSMNNEDFSKIMDEKEALENKRAVLQAKNEELSDLPETINSITRERTKEKRTLKGETESFKKHWVNEYYAIDKLADKTHNKRLSIALDNWIGATNSAETTIEGKKKEGTGQTNIKNERIGKSISEILAPIYKSKKLAEFSDYAYNLHNVDRDSAKKGILKATSSQSAVIAENYEKENPEFKEIKEQLNKFFNNELQNAVDAGIATQELKDKLIAIYPNYVPTYRNITELRGHIEDGKITSNMIRKAVKSDEKLLAVDVSASEYAMNMRKKIALNNLLKELQKSLKVEDEAINVYQLNKMSNDMTEEQTAYVEGYKKSGVNQKSFEDIDAINTVTEEDFINASSENMLQEFEQDNEVYYMATYFESGEAHSFKIPQEIYDLIKPKEIAKTTFGQELVKSANNTFRKAVTTYSPGFTVRNMVKDFQNGLYNTKYGALQYTKNYIRGWKQILTNGQYYANYKNAGMQSNTKYSKTQGMQNNASKTSWQKYNPLALFNTAIETMNTAIESSGRMSEWISSIEAGEDIDTAKYNASEVTLNFKRGGDYSKTLTRYGATFLNSSVLAVNKIVENVTGKTNGTKGIANFITVGLISGVALGLLNHITLGDDDDYEELEDYIKDGYFLIPKGDGTFWRIPKDSITTAIGSTARRIYEMASGEEDVSELGDMLSTIFDNLGVNNPITENIYAPIVQALNNKAWYGEEIVSDYYSGLAPELQYDARTDEISKNVSSALAKLSEGTKSVLENIPIVSQAYEILSSPKLLNYVVDQYSGGIGDIILPFVTPYAEENYIEKELTTDSVLKSKYPGEVYDLYDKYETAYNSYGENELEYKYLTSAKKDLSDLYAEKREIESSTELSDSEKKEHAREIQKKINSTAKEILDNLENMTTTDNTATIGDTEYYKNEDDEWTKITSDVAEGLSTSTYANYKNAIAEATEEKREETGKENAKLSNTEEINILLNGNYSDEEMEAIYTNYIADDDDTTYANLQILTDNNTDIKTYLEYKVQEFKADEDASSNIVGTTVSGSKKKKVIAYLESSGLSKIEQLYLEAKAGYSLEDSEEKYVEEYVINNVAYKYRKDLLIEFGAKEYKDGSIGW